MRTLKSISKVLLVAFSLAIAVSCDNDDDNGGGGGGGNGVYLRAKVNGQNWSNSSLVEPSATLNMGILNILASNNSGDAFNIQIPNFTGEGTYNNGNNDLMAGYINYMDMGSVGQFTSYTSVRGEGQVIVTEVTETHIKGTFTATAPENIENPVQSVTITNGEFRIALQ